MTLTGRQLYLLRVRDTKLSRCDLASKLCISDNEMVIYEYETKPIPQDLYDKWFYSLKEIIEKTNKKN